MKRSAAVLGLVVAFCLFLKAGVHATQAGQLCAQEHAQWTDAYGILEKAVNELREAKQESVGPKINRALAEDTRGSVAQRIQVILKERGRRITEATRKAVDAAGQERSAFEQFRRCGLSDSPRSSGASNAALNEATRERNGILADLQELLLDEAYVQYRRESPVPPSTYSGYGPDRQSAQYQTPQYNFGRRMGYDTYTPGFGYR
jgi:hypothetical protein